MILRTMPSVSLASLPGNGERGLKRSHYVAIHRIVDASLPGNGERGLKLRELRLIVGGALASLPGNGERGLKPACGKRRYRLRMHRSPATGSVD